jgi:hypothetical protein
MVELLNWMLARNAMSGEVSVTQSNCHIPISNAMLLEHHG